MSGEIKISAWYVGDDNDSHSVGYGPAQYGLSIHGDPDLPAKFLEGDKTEKSGSGIEMTFPDSPRGVAELNATVIEVIKRNPRRQFGSDVSRNAHEKGLGYIDDIVELANQVTRYSSLVDAGLSLNRP